MPNPRYSPEPTSRRDSKLATALQFANLGLEQQQIADRSQSARVAAAIQMLGLQRQQEQDAQQAQQAANLLGYHQADLGFRKDANAQQGEQFKQKLGFDQQELAMRQGAQDNASGQFWQGTLPLAYAQNDEAKQGHAQALSHAILGYMQGNPSISPAIGLNYASQLDPQLGSAMTSAHQQTVADQVAKLSGMYGAADSKARTTLEMGLTPEVVQGLRGSIPQQPQQPQNAPTQSAPDPMHTLGRVYDQVYANRLAHNNPQLEQSSPVESPDQFLARQWERLKQWHYNFTQPYLLDPRENRAWQKTQYNNP